jgi:protein-disulfide isomerase
MKKILVILGVVAVLAVIGAAIYEQVNRPTAPSGPVAGGTPGAGDPGAAQAALQIRPTDVVLGQPDAKVTIIEYASLTCPHCAAFHNNVLAAVKTQYIDKGQVRLAFRDFPLDGLALRAAMLPHCAGPERYFGLLGTLFARQQQWATNPDPLGALGALAGQAGMSPDAFKACLSDKKVEETVLASQLEGNKTLGVNSTPTFFINGWKYSGGLTLDQMRSILDPLVGAPTTN